VRAGAEANTLSAKSLIATSNPTQPGAPRRGSTNASELSVERWTTTVA
jgi:hypothetical protein